MPVAQVVADAAAQLGELPPAQLYTGTTATGGTDPARFDGAINRSDHASFQEQGYPAVLVELEKIDLEGLDEVIVEAWLCRAPKRLADAYLSDRG